MSDFKNEDATYEEKLKQYEYEKEVYERNQKIYENSMNTWKNLNESKKEQEKQFDKISFSVAAGSFGVSFAFIDRVVPLVSAVHLPLLAVAWALFGICMIVILIGFRSSSIAYASMCDEESRNLNNRYEDKPVEYKKRNAFLNIPEICNNIALITNVGGIACLIIFVFLNF